MLQSTQNVSPAKLDPGLSRLLEKILPERPQAEVWIAFCEGTHIVPVGQSTIVDFGPWYGPPMPLKDVVIHARMKGREGSALLDAGSRPPNTLVHAGINLSARVLVFEVPH